MEAIGPSLVHFNGTPGPQRKVGLIMRIIPGSNMRTFENLLKPRPAKILRFRTHFQIWNTFQIQGVHEVEEVYAKVLQGRGQDQEHGKMWESRPQSELSMKV